jgi:hypothetical protein
MTTMDIRTSLLGIAKLTNHNISPRTHFIRLQIEPTHVSAGNFAKRGNPEFQKRLRMRRKGLSSSNEVDQEIAESLCTLPSLQPMPKHYLELYSALMSMIPELEALI